MSIEGENLFSPRSKSLLQQRLVLCLGFLGELRCGANLGGGGEGREILANIRYNGGQKYCNLKCDTSKTGDLPPFHPEFWAKWVAHESFSFDTKIGEDRWGLGRHKDEPTQSRSKNSLLSGAEYRKTSEAAFEFYYMSERKIEKWNSIRRSTSRGYQKYYSALSR